MFSRFILLAKTTLIIFLPLHAFDLHAQSLLQNSSPFGAGEPLIARFSTPMGFERLPAAPGSFAAFLRHLPLRADGTPVKNFRGQIFKKSTDPTVAAVIDLDLHQKKLEQCMDVLQRFYAEYLITQSRFGEIKFSLPDKSLLAWFDWRDGWRPQRDGGEFPLNKTAPIDSSRASFEAYLREIFYYSGTETAYFGLEKISPLQIDIGDMLIKRGRRGHAVMIVDLAVNKSGDKIAIFAQGDTPACEPYILKLKDGSPWFSLDFSTPAPNLPISKKMNWDGVRRF